ncbi:MAG: DNA cytosine methyltransferase [Bryobacterales bacterium]|nr:DNA cytosine methyltransferase [Bryobacterales bacterium]
MRPMRVLELCAGAGGQALGLERAGFEHAALVELDKDCCRTLRANRPEWEVLEHDIRTFDASEYHGVDLVAGGLPCPPFSVAGKQLGNLDERNLFPDALRIVRECQPKAVMIENVRGILDAVFSDYRRYIQGALSELGYTTDWALLNASSFGVPQLRPRVVFVGVKSELWPHFHWPIRLDAAPTVGEALFDLMASNGWPGVQDWKEQANLVAPTIVGGSKKHGGPDLGPTRARAAWAVLGVDGKGIANEPPGPDFVGMPRLTVRMVARIQGFPDNWQFTGGKTSSYRQVGNAFPPPVAEAVATQLSKCLSVRILERKAS